jgi:hypothetical protein
MIVRNDFDDVKWMKMNAMKTSRASWRASTERESNRALTSGIGTAAAAAEKGRKEMRARGDGQDCRSTERRRARRKEAKE